MNIFTLAITILFMGAASVELKRGDLWQMVIYLGSAAINLAFIMRVGK